MTIRLSILTPLVLGLTAVWMSGLSQAAPQRGGGKVTPTLTVTVSPGTIAEGQTATGTVKRVNVVLTPKLTVTLQSSDPSEAFVNATVDIEDGADSATFDVTGVIDGINGAKTVTITAAATNFKSGSTNVTAATPALPPIAFDLRVLPTPAGPNNTIIWDMNNRLQAVGFVQTQTANGSFIVDGFMYDYYDPNILLTIDDLISPKDMSLLVAGGWTESIFRGINDLGMIVGEVKNSDRTAERGLILDTRTYDPTATLPTYATVYFPDSNLDFAALGSSRLRKVNNRGDIFGNFLVPGIAFVFNPGLLQVTDLFSVRSIAGTDGLNLHSPRIITDSGRVMLSYQGGITDEYDIVTEFVSPVSSAGNGWQLSGIHESGRYFGKKLYENQTKNSEKGVPIVVDWVDGSWKIVWQQDVENGRTTAINGPSAADLSRGINQGDIITREVEYVSRFNYTAELYLYSPEWGKVHMDKLVLPDQLNVWKALLRSGPLMSEKFLDTNFGAIADYYGWMLVPIPVP